MKSKMDQLKLLSLSLSALSMLFSSPLIMAKSHHSTSYEEIALKTLQSSYAHPSLFESIAIQTIRAKSNKDATNAPYDLAADNAAKATKELNQRMRTIKISAKGLPTYESTASKAFEEFSSDIKNKLSTKKTGSHANIVKPQAKHITYLNMTLPDSRSHQEGRDSLTARKVQLLSVSVPSPKQTTAKKNSNTKPAKTTRSSRFSLGQTLGLGPKSRIQIDGFISAGASETNAKSNAVVNTVFGPTLVPVRYRIPGHGDIQNNLTFNANSLVGIQITGHIVNQVLDAVVQLVADGDNTNGNKAYRVQAEWAFLRTRAGEHFETRAGRFRLPAFLYSETQQVGYTYPWIFLPNEVYRIIPFENLNGIDFIYTYPLGNTGWDIQVQPYYGAESSQFDLYTRGAVPIAPFSVPIPQGKTADFNGHNIFGVVLNFNNPYFIIRGTYIRATLSSFINDFVVPGAGEVNLPLFSNQKATFYSVGFRVNWHWLVVNAEFAHRDTPAQIANLTGYYAMIGAHLGEFLPNFTYADIRTTNENTLLSQPVSEFPQNQRSYTLGLAYYIHSNVVAKTSVSLIQPSGNGLFTANPGRRNVFLYGFSLDAIF